MVAPREDVEAAVGDATVVGEDIGQRHGLVVVRAHQERAYPARVSGTTLRNPDFVGLARSYGFHAERVESTGDFAAAFRRAAASGTGAVLSIAISPEALARVRTIDRQIEMQARVAQAGLASLMGDAARIRQRLKGLRQGQGALSSDSGTIGAVA